MAVTPQMGGLSQALQGAYPLLLSASQGLRQGNLQGGIAAGLQGMQALQERNEQKAADEKIKELMGGMSMSSAERAILETMPIGQKQTYLLNKIQRDQARARAMAQQAARAASRPVGGGVPAPAPVDPYAAVLGPLAGGMSGAAPKPNPVPAPSVPLSFGTPTVSTSGGGGGAMAGGAGEDTLAMGSPLSGRMSFAASEQAMGPAAPIRTEAPTPMAMPAPPPPEPVDPIEQAKTRIGQIDDAIQRMAVNPDLASSTDGRRFLASLMDARANLVARIEAAGPSKEYRTMQLADGRTYYVDPTGQEPPRLVAPDLQVEEKTSAREDQIARMTQLFVQQGMDETAAGQRAAGIVDGVLVPTETGGVINLGTGQLEGAEMIPQGEIPQGGFGAGLFDRATEATGVGPRSAQVASDTLGQLPLVGGLFNFPDQVKAGQAFNLATNELIRALSLNPRFPVAEIQRIKNEINIEPGFMKSPETMKSRMKEIDRYLADRMQYEAGIANGAGVPMETRLAAQRAFKDLQRFRSLLGVPDGDSQLQSDIELMNQLLKGQN